MAAHRKDLDDSTIIDLYLQGKSSTEIAKQLCSMCHHKIHGQL